MTRRHDPTTAAGIVASLLSMTTSLESAGPEEAADLLTDVFARGGVLDEITEVLTSTRHLILAHIPADEWGNHQPGYALYHRLADTAEHLYDQTQELRGAPQILRVLSDPASSACRPEPNAADQARPAPSASPLPPPAVTPLPAPTSPRTTR